MKTCPFCAEEIQDAAIKCKHCGEMLETGIDPSLIQKSDSAPQRKTKADLIVVKGTATTGAAGSFLALGCGVWIFGLMMLFGFLLCCTGIGAIIGLPMIIGSVMGLVASPVVGGAVGLAETKTWRGDCPSCSHPLTVSTESAGFNCGACAKRLTVVDEGIPDCRTFVEVC